MLTELCAEIRNYFLRDYRKDIHVGTFTISGGKIESLPFLQPGQYFRIVGSVFNDGVWKYDEDEDNYGYDDALTDETFSGAVWAMAVPPAVIALSQEIDDWVVTNKAALDSPYMSESFGGYSYTKGSAYGASGSSAMTWQKQFADKLNNYRRISVL